MSVWSSPVLSADIWIAWSALKRLSKKCRAMPSLCQDVGRRRIADLIQHELHVCLRDEMPRVRVLQLRQQDLRRRGLLPAPLGPLTLTPCAAPCALLFTPVTARRWVFAPAFAPRPPEAPACTRPGASSPPRRRSGWAPRCRRAPRHRRGTSRGGSARGRRGSTGRPRRRRAPRPSPSSGRWRCGPHIRCLDRT